jgi:signal transduction histidine kinase
MIAHELRTPLISISMSGDLLRRSGCDISQEQFDDLMDSLDAGTRRMSHLVEQMIYTTQLESGALVHEAIRASGTLMPLWNLLTSAIPLARQFATRQRDLNIQLDERDSDASVLCDMPSLKHALAELIANALNFSPAEGQVTVSQWVADNAIWISVTDQGHGISSAQREEVWRTFHQVARETQEQQGLGMGLPLARRIFEIHGGTVTLESVEDKGTQIIVSLPIAP